MSELVWLVRYECVVYVSPRFLFFFCIHRPSYYFIRFISLDCLDWPGIQFDGTISIREITENCTQPIFFPGSSSEIDGHTMAYTRTV